MPLTSHLSKHHEQTQLTAMPVLGLLLVLFAFLAALPVIGFEVPLWIQPSVVGLLWGSLFLSGCWFAFAGHYSWLYVMLIGGSSIVFTVAFRTVTDLSLEESLLASVLLFASGWMAMRFDRRPQEAIAKQLKSSKPLQIPLMDFFIATTLVACTARAISQMSGPPVMLIGIIGTLFIGCGGCWAAYHWAWNDARPIGLPFGITVVLSMIAVVLLIGISPLSTTELAGWLLVGPLSVLATQCFTVLAALAVLRWRIRLAPIVL